MIKYKHQNTPKDSAFPRLTFAIELPSKEFLIEMITQSVSVTTLNMGVAVVHPKDQYVKAIGRQVAESRMHNSLVKFLGAHVREGNRTVFEFENANDVRFGISFIPESKNTRLEYIYAVDYGNNE